MSVSQQLFVKGIDPTGATDLASILIQLIEDAYMAPDKGIIIVSEDTPDVLANSQFGRCLWTKESEDHSVVRRYNPTTSSWETIAIGTGTVITAMLAAGAVTIAKLYSPGAASVGKILQVQAGGSFDLVTYTPADNSITIAKLSKATGNGGKLLRVAGTGDGTGFEFFTLNAANYIATGALPIAALAPGSESQYLRMVGGVPVWTTASPGFNPTYIAAVNLINAQTAAVDTFTTIDLAANLLAAGASTSCRIAILKVYGLVTEDTALVGVFNTRQDSASVTTEMLKVGTTAEGATNKVLSGHSIVFQKLTVGQTFDYQIPSATYFASGLTVDLIGFIAP